MSSTRWLSASVRGSHLEGPGFDSRTRQFPFSVCESVYYGIIYPIDPLSHSRQPLLWDNLAHRSIIP